jgi:hypothetical protein
MKKLLLLFPLNLIIPVIAQAQTVLNKENVSGWLVSGGIHFFPKQLVKPNYEPVEGINIYSKQTRASSLELTRFFKLKGRWSSSIGLRLAQMPSDQGLDIANNLSNDSIPFGDYYKNSLPYATIKGLINFKIFEKNKFSIVQSLGTSLVIIPHGFANYKVSSIPSSGVRFLDYESVGAYNPKSYIFFSPLIQTAFIYAPNERKKWFLSISFESAARDVIVSNYTFYGATRELKGIITRSYQHFGVQIGGFWALKKTKEKE